MLRGGRLGGARADAGAGGCVVCGRIGPITRTALSFRDFHNESVFPDSGGYPHLRCHHSGLLAVSLDPSGVCF